jgi:hypothetical protein
MNHSSKEFVLNGNTRI